MSTQLTRQLAALAGGDRRARGGERASLLPGADGSGAGGPASLEAARGLGLAGLSALAAADARAAGYADDLFSESWSAVDREAQPAEWNAALDARVAAFLRRHCAPRLAGAAAARALEYLVRRFSVHVYSVDALMEAALPYAGTEAFARVLRVLALGGGGGAGGGGALSRIEYLTYAWPEAGTVAILDDSNRVLDDLYAFLEEAAAAGEGALIHCSDGLSRAAFAAAVYLMLK